MEQRRLQIHTDLQPPGNFLESYQGYMAQVVGFFVVEASVTRLAEELLGAGQVSLLWEAALGSMKATVDRWGGGGLGAVGLLLLGSMVRTAALMG